MSAAAGRVAFLEGRLRKARARIAALEARLRGAESSPVELPDWAWALTPQERALVFALRDAYPRVLTDEALDLLLPHNDHAAQRGSGLLPVLVSRARRKIPGGIERAPGLGYRLSAQAALHLTRPQGAAGISNSE